MLHRLIRPRSAPRSAFNLIEAAIALGVISMVLGGILAGANMAVESYRISRTATALIAAANNLRGALPATMATGSLVSLDLTYLTNAKIFPTDFVTTTGIKTLWNTPITASINGGGASTPYIQLTFSMPDKTNCLKFAAAVTSRFKDRTDLYEVAVGDATNGYTAYSAWPLAVDGTHCNVAAFPTELSFRFTFSKNF